MKPASSVEQAIWRLARIWCTVQIQILHWTNISKNLIYSSNPNPTLNWYEKNQIMDLQSWHRPAVFFKATRQLRLKKTGRPCVCYFCVFIYLFILCFRAHIKTLKHKATQYHKCFSSQCEWKAKEKHAIVRVCYF